VKEKANKSIRFRAVVINRYFSYSECSERYGLNIRYVTKYKTAAIKKPNDAIIISLPFDIRQIIKDIAKPEMPTPNAPGISYTNTNDACLESTTDAIAIKIADEIAEKRGIIIYTHKTGEMIRGRMYLTMVEVLKLLILRPFH